jgi:uncharacterized membrane protein YvlD (DUF360 family)
MNLERWKKTRQKGREKYILVNGVLAWGIPTALVWSVTMAILQPSENIWVRPLIALVIFPLGGIGFGYFTWNASEKQYKAKFTNKGLN